MVNNKILIALILFFSISTVSADSARLKAGTCLGCHGIPEYTNVYPSYQVPKLGGQHKEYIISALKAYKNGQRGHLTMHAQAVKLSDQDIADIAQFFASQPLIKEDENPSKKIAIDQNKLATCVACHGAQGNSPIPTNPRLAGQYRSYLYRALQDYKSGERKNAIMAGMVSTLTDKDMQDLAVFYAANKGLVTIPLGRSTLVD